MKRDRALLLRGTPALAGLASLILLVGGCDSGMSAPADSGAPSDASLASDSSSPWPPVRDSGAAAPPPPPGAPTPGLRVLARVEHPTAGPHLLELASFGDVFYVANSNDVFGAYLREADGGLLTTLIRPPPIEPSPTDPFVRCTTLSIHRGSSTLYCSGDDQSFIRTYDVTDAERPVLRDRAALSVPGLFVRDLAAIDDVLYISRFDQGLWVAAIDGAGALGPATPTAVTSNVRFVGGDDRGDDESPLVALAQGVLLVLEGRGAELTVAHEVPLEGPPLGLRVHGGRAAVASGSAGASLYDVSAGVPRLLHTFRPAGVVTAVDFEGDTFALTTLSGAYLYDLGETPPRLAGFVPAGLRESRDSGVMLDLQIVAGELVVSDWTSVARLAIDLEGEVLGVDHPRGMYLAPGADGVMSLRSESALEMAVEVHLGAESFDVVIAPGASTTVTIPSASIDRLTQRGPYFSGTVSSAPSRWPTLRTITEVAFARRQGTAMSPALRPVPGDPFPSVAMADEALEIYHLPTRGVRERLVFFPTDCAAMWPVLEDAASLWRRGELDSGAVLRFLTRADVGAGGWSRRWGLVDVPYGHYHTYAPPEVATENGTSAVYDDLFKLDAVPRGASHPTDYVVDEDGIVESVDTYYRGAFPLR